MKRFIMIAVMAICAIGVWAASPKLACAEFIEKCKRSKDVERVVISTGTDSYYRSVNIENNPTLLGEMRRAVEKDRKLASNTVESYRGGGEEESVILNIPSNGYLINIGLSVRGNGCASLFVEGNPGALK